MEEHTRWNNNGHASSTRLLYVTLVIIIAWLSVLSLDSVRQHRTPNYVSNGMKNTEYVEKVSEIEKKVEKLIQTEIPAQQQEGTRVMGGVVDNSWRFTPGMTYLDALPSCQTLKCIREAHKLPRGKVKYNFPHFFIAGYSKSASTSLYQYLNKHPTVLPPHEKEPLLFTDMCHYERGKMDCPYGKQREYIHDILKVENFVESGGTLAPYQATPRVMDLGTSFAEILREYMPWLKLVSSMREPISRSMSKYIMAKDKFYNGCLMDHTMAFCLRRDKERLFGERQDEITHACNLVRVILNSLVISPPGNPKEAYYSRPLKAWLDNYPKDQILLLQYEEVVSPESQASQLKKLKKFIGIEDDLLGDELDSERVVCRHCTINPEGWPMKEKVYRKLLEMIMPDVLELVRLIDEFQLGNGTRWFENWSKVWDKNLAACVDGMCNITLS